MQSLWFILPRVGWRSILRCLLYAPEQMSLLTSLLTGQTPAWSYNLLTFICLLLHRTYHCSSHTSQPDCNKTSVEKHESSLASFLLHLSMIFLPWPPWTTFSFQPSHWGDSPDLRRQCLLESPLQILHVGRFWPGDEGRAPLLSHRTGWVVWGTGCSRRLLGQLAAKPVESPVHLIVVLAGRHFIEGASQCSRQHRALLRVNPPQVQQVCLVSQQDYWRHVRTSCTNNELMQLIDEFEAAPVRHRVHQHHGISPLDGAGHMVRQADCIICHLGWKEKEWFKKQFCSYLEIKTFPDYAAEL